VKMYFEVTSYEITKTYFTFIYSNKDACITATTFWQSWVYGRNWKKAILVFKSRRSRKHDIFTPFIP